MNLSRPFILRPVATSLLMAAILLAGIVAYRQLPVSALPEVDYPTIQVLTFYPGASPDVMASSVTAPLERQFGQVPGLNQMTSNSSFGSSVITLQFVLTLNIDVAEQEVQAAINAAATYLPPDLPNPPIYSKTNPADAPILTLALTSDQLPLTQVEDLADTRLAQKISQVSGVGLVSISGGQKPAVRVQANPTALASYGLSLENIRSAIAAANVDEAKGNFDGSQQAYTIGANDQLLTSAAYKPLVVAYRNGAPVRLEDVATVVDGAENVKQAAWMNNVPAVIVNVQRQPGANIITVVDQVKALLPRLQAALPGSVKVVVLTDRTTTIRASVQDVEFELLLTIALVVMVIFLFLRNLSGDDHPEHRGSALTGRNVRRDVPAGIQPEQSDTDGADDFDGLRGGRRDRDDREHRPLYRRGRNAVGSGAEGFGADRVHDFIVDGIVDRGVDTVAVHGRYRGPAVSGIRGNVGGDNPGLGGGFADADADDVRETAEAHAGGRTRPLLSRDRTHVRRYDRVLRHHTEMGVASSGGHPVGRSGDANPDGSTLHHRTEGLLSGAGYRGDPGGFGIAAVSVVSSDGGASTGLGASDSKRSCGRKPLIIHRDRRDQHHGQ